MWGRLAACGRLVIGQRQAAAIFLRRFFAKLFPIPFPAFTTFTHPGPKFPALSFNREVGAPIGVQPAGA
jgi:hypothetical protein